MAAIRRLAGMPGAYPIFDQEDGLGSPREYRKTATVLAVQLPYDAEIETPEGVMSAKAGDYLAQHSDGHAWPIKRETFESTYEAV